MRKPLIAAGIILVVFAAAWKWGISPRWEQRFPEGWQWRTDYLGTNLWADEDGNFPDQEFPDDDPINVSERVISIDSTNPQTNRIELSDHFVTRDANTNAITWEYTYKSEVDPVTGQFIDPAYVGDYFLFPRGVQKETYHIRNTSYPGLPVEFQGEENISGVNTYKFAFVGEYDNSAAYPDVKLEDGQAIKCSNMELRFWVEPVTGEVVKYSERCQGDVVYNTATGENLYFLSRWAGETTGDDLIRQVGRVRSELINYNLFTLYIPVGTFVLGVIALVVGVLPRKQIPA